ncbi:MAG: phosphatidylserine decarboxylase [Peptococcaceae bacterium BRH_c8a]|nr:MAG: phosphatidylserine decarboxylase [Peptococcaceae bacterium BRH_c8a]
MVARESVPYLLVSAVLGILFYAVLPALAVLPAVAFLFILFFFRNPGRQIPKNDTHVLSPADGRVQAIETIDYEDTFIQGKAVRISIFLSMLNVHFNRSPINGKIIYTVYRPGKYLPAFKSHASGLNERNTVGIENSQMRVLVHQITGFVARRIVCYPQKGDRLEQGQVFGLIKFGSCTEILVPADVKVLVREGQKVTAGITVLGVLEDD